MDCRDDLSYEYYYTMLRIDQTRLDEMIEAQPQMLAAIGQQAAIEKSMVEKAKESLRRADAELFPVVEEQLIADGEKATVAAVNAGVLRHKKHRHFHNKYVAQMAKAGEWESLRESSSQRSFGIRDAVLLQINELNGESVMTGRPEVDQRAAEDRRRKINEQRRSKADKKRTKPSKASRARVK